MERQYRVGEKVVRVGVRPASGAGPGRRYAVAIDGRAVEIELLRNEGGVLLVRAGDRLIEGAVAAAGDRRAVQCAGRTPVEIELATAATARRRHREGSDDTLSATMHSQVVAVLVKPGDPVARGAPLVVLEAMKMEVRLTAPHDGVVREVTCKVGEVVERGRVLVAVAPAGAAS